MTDDSNRIITYCNIQNTKFRHYTYTIPIRYILCDDDVFKTDVEK